MFGWGLSLLFFRMGMRLAMRSIESRNTPAPGPGAGRGAATVIVLSDGTVTIPNRQGTTGHNNQGIR